VTPQYLFILGNAPELAEEELWSVLATREITPETLNLLGGTVKVAEIFDVPIADKLIEGKNSNERVTFGLSGDTNIHDAKEVKDNLENLGFKARFVLPKFGENELSSVVVTKQMIEEVYLLPELTAKTFWVQDFEDWGKRDYGRPAFDPHIGMIPPKVARMMVNIALSGKRQEESCVILDPFCGVGTILAEGLMVRAKVIGSDIDSRQVERTKKNLEWLADGYQVSSIKYQVSQTDARQVSKKIAPQSIDAIVTEPDLGPAKINNYQLPIINKNLLDLYCACLEDWKKILKSNGKVVMAVPSFVISENSLPIRVDSDFMKILIDKAKIMGYSLISGPFAYFRPQAVVRRNICIFRLTTSN